VRKENESGGGRFYSVVYRAGKIQADASRPVSVEMHPSLETTVNGLKSEGLSGPSGEVPGGGLCIGTDDEIYGGIWRNLRKK
ncbi:MAG: hypothetical protein MJA29_04820, partial [Candidatus Omnitrophica bacterium]|nr:hypothetical protein [Candidatus Omnitrophota bacterium]